MKKQWLSPKLKNLGVENTLTDEIMEIREDGKIIYGCKYCWERFWTKDDLNKHIEKKHTPQHAIEMSPILPGNVGSTPLEPSMPLS